MKIFVASNFENKDAARELENKLREQGHEITSTWVDQEPLTDLALAPVHSENDLKELDAANVLVILWPGKQGTLSEFGHALKRKPVILYGDVPYERGVLGGNLHFHNPSVYRTETEAELYALLQVFEAEKARQLCLLR